MGSLVRSRFSLGLTVFLWFSFKKSFNYFYTVVFVLRTFVKTSSYSSLPNFETRLLTLLIKLLCAAASRWKIVGKYRLYTRSKVQKFTDYRV